MEPEIFRRKSILTSRSGSIVILIGVLIILTGITLMGLQMLDSNGTDTQNHSFKLIGAEVGSTKFQIETTFPGLLVMALGIFLLITGAILSR
jgi:uncharacterized membrane protein